MKSHNLTDTDASSWQKSGMFLVVLPEQPPDGYNHYAPLIDNNKHLIYFRHSSHDVWCVKLPYSIGDTVGFRETWGYKEFEGWSSQIVYKADLNEDEWEKVKHKRSPTTLWDGNIRKWGKIASVDCERAQELSIRQKNNLIYSKITKGYEVRQTTLEFIEWFNDRYGKPEAVKEKGKIVEYIYYCYSLDSIDIPNTLANRKNYNIDEIRNCEYKKKPLTFISNPYIELCGYKEVEK